MINTSSIIDLLNKSLSFYDNFTKNSFPLLITSNFLVSDRFHLGSTGLTKSDDMLSAIRAAFLASEVTSNPGWNALGLNIISAYLDNFFINDTPQTNRTWESHHTCVTRIPIPTEGNQNNVEAFNYGNFDTIVNFNNGVGVIPSGFDVSTVFKVYSTNSTLKYQNVYSPLNDGGEELPIDYWVSNYKLLGNNYQLTEYGYRSVSSEQPGTIHLTSDFTGQAKVVWSEYRNETIPPPSVALSGNSLAESYPILHRCKGNQEIILNATFASYYSSWDVFNLLAIRSESGWQRRGDAIKTTVYQSLRLQNLSYTPGISPEFRNTITSLSNESITKDVWNNGLINMGSLSPYHLFIWGDIEAANNQISFIADAFTAYSNQSETRDRGLPIPNFYLDVPGSHNELYAGKFNNFGWHDSNSYSFFNVAIAMESLARYVYVNPTDFKAKSLVSQYVGFLKANYDYRGSLRPLTDIVPSTSPQSNYHNPANAATIGRAAIYANLAGINPIATSSLIDICYQYISSESIDSGVMTGSFAKNQNAFGMGRVTGYKEYFSRWHSEIIQFLALLVKHKDFLNYLAPSTPPVYTQPTPGNPSTPPPTSDTPTNPGTQPTSGNPRTPGSTPINTGIVYVGVFPSVDITKVTQIKESPYNKEQLNFTDGNRQTLRYRKSQSGLSITLDYQMITELEVETLVTFWQRHGTSELFTLPTSLPILNRWRERAGNLNYWRISQAFSIETVVATSIRGVFNTSITIIQD